MENFFFNFQNNFEFKKFCEKNFHIHYHKLMKFIFYFNLDNFFFIKNLNKKKSYDFSKIYFKNFVAKFFLNIVATKFFMKLKHINVTHSYICYTYIFYTYSVSKFRSMTYQ